MDQLKVKMNLLVKRAALIQVVLLVLMTSLFAYYNAYNGSRGHFGIIKGK